MTAIELRGIHKIFGPDPARAMALVEAGATKAEVLRRTGHSVGLRDVNLSIEAGRTFVVMGLSGSGKSTLIRHLNRLIEPTAGQILVDGQDILALDRAGLSDLRRRRMSMVFQRFGLFPHKTVTENVAFGLDIQAGGRAARRRNRERAREWIETVGLSGYEDALPHVLSGGMQQRVGLARALATDAEVLLMDEPFGALDPLIRADMQDQLRDLQARFRKTIVFITHDLDEALRLGDTIAILRDGVIQQIGSGEDILTNPANDHVARFVRDVNRGRVLTAGSVKRACVVLGARTTPAAARAALRAGDTDIVQIVDDDGRLLGSLTEAAARGALGQTTGSVEALVEPVPTAREDMVLEEVLALTLKSDLPIAVVDADGRPTGILPKDTIIAALADRAGLATRETGASAV